MLPDYKTWPSLDYNIYAEIVGECAWGKGGCPVTMQNLVDLVWRDKPPRSKEPIYIQPQEFTGMSAGEKLARLREWIRQQRPSMPSYSKAEPKPLKMQVATLVANLSSIGT